jgi:hypothetical protein
LNKDEVLARPPGTLSDAALDVRADQITIDLLLEVFGPFGITTRACDVAAVMVALNDDAFADPETGHQETGEPA